MSDPCRPIIDAEIAALNAEHKRKRAALRELMRRKAAALDLLEVKLRNEWAVKLYLLNDECVLVGDRGLTLFRGSTLLETIERAEGK